MNSEFNNLSEEAKICTLGDIVGEEGIKKLAKAIMEAESGDVIKIVFGAMDDESKSDEENVVPPQT